jgi:hypothetical protein
MTQHTEGAAPAEAPCRIWRVEVLAADAGEGDYYVAHADADEAKEMVRDFDEEPVGVEAMPDDEPFTVTMVDGFDEEGDAADFRAKGFTVDEAADQPTVTGTFRQWAKEGPGIIAMPNY